MARWLLAVLMLSGVMSGCIVVPGHEGGYGHEHAYYDHGRHHHEWR